MPLAQIEGKYEILAKLSEGGMGAIYKVRHRLLDEVRVVKVMRPHLAGDEALNERFRREARTAIRLRHPGIAELYDFAVDPDGVAYIVMEFIEGHTLDHILRASELPPIGLTLAIGGQVLDALAFLHDQGFVHRDISPDNLMLTVDARHALRVKIIDLGIAKTLAEDQRLTATGMFLGKLRYAAPEGFAAAGAAAVDARSDLYSFGIVLYEMLTGTFPIVGEDQPALIAGHLFHPPRSFEETDPGGTIAEELRQIVREALAKEPDERIPDARGFGKRLKALEARYPLDQPDAGHTLIGAAPPAPEPLEVGSTQSRLNRQFVAGTTPAHPPTPAMAARPASLRATEDRSSVDDTSASSTSSSSAPGDHPEAQPPAPSTRSRALSPESADKSAPVHSPAVSGAPASRDSSADAPEASRELAGEQEAGTREQGTREQEAGTRDGDTREQEAGTRDGDLDTGSEARALLENARTLAQGGELSAAGKQLREAMRLAPDNSPENSQGAALHQWLETQRAAQFVQAARQQLDANQPKEALEAARMALALRPAHREAHLLRTRAEQALSQRDALAPARATADTLADVAKSHAETEDRDSRSALEATIRAPAPDLPGAGGRSASPRALRAWRPIARAALVAVVIGSAAWMLGPWLVARGSAMLRLERPPPTAIENRPVQEARTATGTLVLDARPWAEVTRLVDPRGRDVPLADHARFTPVALALPPGTYAVTLRHPSVPESQTFSVAVEAEAIHRPRPPIFVEVDAKKLLSELGL